ncbi:MAG TPA: helix-turn-helix domain-containing protein [archaeon]|nr:helix-turn-helix domain-containing protein [archaeon]
MAWGLPDKPEKAKPAREESVVLLPLGEERTKGIAQALSNETARSILNCLSRKSATASQVSRELSMPLSTVHYNLEVLEKSELVVVEKTHYSPKGSVVKTYAPAKKLIVLAPQGTESMASRLKQLLPAVALLALLSFFVDSAFYSMQSASLPIAQKSLAAPSSGIERSFSPSTAEVESGADSYQQQSVPARQEFGVTPGTALFLAGLLALAVIAFRPGKKEG